MTLSQLYNKQEINDNEIDMEIDDEENQGTEFKFIDQIPKPITEDVSLENKEDDDDLDDLEDKEEKKVEEEDAPEPVPPTIAIAFGSESVDHDSEFEKADLDSLEGDEKDKNDEQDRNLHLDSLNSPVGDALRQVQKTESVDNDAVTLSQGAVPKNFNSTSSVVDTNNEFDKSVASIGDACNTEEDDLEKLRRKV